MILKGVKRELDVKVEAEIDQGLGVVESVCFVCTFRKPPVSEAKELMRRLQSDDGVDDETLMDEYLLGWREVYDAEGSPVEFSREAVKDMLDVREYRLALSSALLSVVLGKQALAKN